jgi:hypothetical protein
MVQTVIFEATQEDGERVRDRPEQESGSKSPGLFVRQPFYFTLMESDGASDKKQHGDRRFHDGAYPEYDLRCSRSGDKRPKSHHEQYDPEGAKEKPRLGRARSE